MEYSYQELANLEIAPDTKLVVRIDLSDRDPFMVSAYGSKLSVCETCARGREAAPHACVVAVGGTGLPRLVGNFMVVLTVQVSAINIPRDPVCVTDPS